MPPPTMAIRRGLALLLPVAITSYFIVVFGGWVGCRLVNETSPTRADVWKTLICSARPVPRFRRPWCFRRAVALLLGDVELQLPARYRLYCPRRQSPSQCFFALVHDRRMEELLPQGLRNRMKYRGEQRIGCPIHNYGWYRGNKLPAFPVITVLSNPNWPITASQLSR